MKSASSIFKVLLHFLGMITQQTAYAGKLKKAVCMIVIFLFFQPAIAKAGLLRLKLIETFPEETAEKNPPVIEGTIDKPPEVSEDTAFNIFLQDEESKDVASVANVPINKQSDLDDILEGAKVKLKLVMKKPSSIEGKVTEMLDGKPVGIAYVRVLIPGSPYSTYTDESGLYKLGEIAGGGFYTIKMLKAGYKTGVFEGIKIRSETEEFGDYFNFNLYKKIRYGNIQGKVTLAGSSDSTGIIVALAGTSHLASTDKMGNFEIENVLVGEHSILFTKDGYITKRVGAEVFENKTVNVRSVELGAGKSNAVAGSVIFGNRTEHGGITVSIDTEPPLERTTHMDGSYLFENVPPANKYSVKFAYPGYGFETKSVDVISGETTVVDGVTLTGKLVGIKGSVRDENGNPVGGAFVSIVGTSFIQVCDEEGKYKFEAVPISGDYDIAASKQGYENTAIEPITNVLWETLKAGNDVNLELAKLKTKSKGATGLGSISGYTSLKGGNGLVTVIAEKDTDIATNTANRVSVTGSGGPFLMKNVEEGFYFLRYFGGSDYTAIYKEKIAVVAGKITSVWNTAVGWNKRNITGEVHLNGEQSNNYSNITIVAQNDRGETYETITEDSGRFKIKAPPAANYLKIEAYKADYASKEVDGYEDKTLLSGGSLDAEGFITLTRTHNTVSGRVALEGKADYSGVTVTLSSDTGGVGYSLITSSGDVDGDGELGPNDAALLLKYSKKGITEQERIGILRQYPSLEIKGDLNRDGIISKVDAKRVLDKVAEGSTDIKEISGNFEFKHVLIGDAASTITYTLAFKHADFSEYICKVHVGNDVKFDYGCDNILLSK